MRTTGIASQVRNFLARQPTNDMIRVAPAPEWPHFSCCASPHYVDHAPQASHNMQAIWHALICDLPAYLASEDQSVVKTTEVFAPRHLLRHMCRLSTCALPKASIHVPARLSVQFMWLLLHMFEKQRRLQGTTDGS